MHPPTKHPLLERILSRKNKDIGRVTAENGGALPTGMYGVFSRVPLGKRCKLSPVSPEQSWISISKKSKPLFLMSEDKLTSTSAFQEESSSVERVSLSTPEQGIRVLDSRGLAHAYNYQTEGS